MRRLGEGLREHLPFGRKEQREMMADAYLQMLSETDRARVSGLVAAIGDRIEDFRGARVGVIAFGSSIKPEHLRFHPVQDIDLRIVTSSTPESLTQGMNVETAVGVVRAHLDQQGFEYDFNQSFTTHQRVVEVVSTDPETGKSVKKLEQCFLDYNNDDPSFEVHGTDDTLPLHISISGPGLDTLDTHLKEERRQKQYFSVLGSFSPQQ